MDLHSASQFISNKQWGCSSLWEKCVVGNKEQDFSKQHCWCSKIHFMFLRLKSLNTFVSFPLLTHQLDDQQTKESVQTLFLQQILICWNVRLLIKLFEREVLNFQKISTLQIVLFDVFTVQRSQLWAVMVSLPNLYEVIKGLKILQWSLTSDLLLLEEMRNLSLGKKNRLRWRGADAARGRCNKWLLGVSVQVHAIGVLEE